MTYPTPRLPARPVLSARSLHRGGGLSFPSIFDGRRALRFTKGRYALAKALQLSRVTASTKVLLPSYNCPAMVAPIRWLGAEPTFYRVREDLSIDLEDLDRRVCSDTRCVIAVHYFGFPQDLGPVQRFCQERGLVLIEDCAHCLYGAANGRIVGTFGDFAVASLMKFFPIYDGGCLVSARSFATESHQTRGGLAFQFRALLNPLEYSFSYGRLPSNSLWNPVFFLKNRISAAAKSLGFVRATAPTKESVEGGHRFESAWINVNMSWSSAALLKFLSPTPCAQARRANYARLLKQLESVPGGRALYNELPANVVPYVFPYLIENPSSVFSELKKRRVPLLRWEYADVTVCSVSRSYSESLVLVPCHQGLTIDDIDWICTHVREVLATDKKNRLVSSNREE